VMEKRHSHRTNIEPLEIVIEKIDSSERQYENVTLIINDVSSEGMRFTTNVEFSPDETIQCHLPSMNIATLLSGRITWKKAVGMNQFQYGLEIYK
jgi:predicted GTPase